jgi:hypothetical protein
LAEKGVCATADVNKERDGFYNINAVNGYHSFIKERNRSARGFATKCLNRCNALFSAAYGCGSFLADDVYRMLCDSAGNKYRTVYASQNECPLDI